MVELQLIDVHDNCVGDRLYIEQFNPPKHFNSYHELEEYRNSIIKERSIADGSPISVYLMYKKLN